MEKTKTYNFDKNFISQLVNYLQKNFIESSKYNLSSTAIIFGGKRPSLFVKRELAKRVGEGFYPPSFFSIDEFIRHIVEKRSKISYIPDLDACYTIYNITKKVAPEVLKNRKRFSQFLPWAREISSFIQELDLEKVENQQLGEIKKSAEIGYEIPNNINHLLKKIIFIRKKYHEKLQQEKRFSRGLMYLTASNIISEVELEEFNKVIFCNFYYLNKAEENVIKYLYENDKAILLFQKDNREWPVLKDNSDTFSCDITPRENKLSEPDLNIYKGFDIHSQTGIVRKILKDIDGLEDTIVVLPKTSNLIPLLSELSSQIDEFNVSMGYPLNRSTLYSLIQSIFEAQKSSKEEKYYAKDYLKVLTHPLVKNLMMLEEPYITRVIVHKIEEILSGMEETTLSGSLFIKLEDIENSSKLYPLVTTTLAKMGEDIEVEEIENVISHIHDFLFRKWERIENFTAVSNVVSKFLNLLVNKSFIANYPLNLKVVEKIFNINDELGNAVFKNEKFTQEEIFKILSNKLEGELVSFYGSPLKGLQILGLFETRALTFKNVIVMDMNESVLPKLRVYEPLIPREVMVSLGLNRSEQEEEIQRYHFMRLISSADNVHLVYNNHQEEEKSRFIEEILWNREKEEGAVKVVEQPQAKFRTEVMLGKEKIEKTPQMVEILKNFTFSASSIDTYLNCPLQFYYKYILRLEEKKEMLEEPESSEIGSFFHQFLEKAFTKFIGKEPVIDESFKHYFLEKFDKNFREKLAKRIGSESFLDKYVMEYRIEKFLEKEKERNIKEILSLEKQFFKNNIDINGEKFNFKCIVDRIDRLKDDSILIIDYKTGSSTKTPKSLNSLGKMKFERESIKNSIKSFQLPLYYSVVKRRYENNFLNAVLYSIKNLKLSPFIKKRDIGNSESVIQICLEALKYIIKEIVNSEVPFVADDTQPRRCEYCPFFYLCR